MDARTVDLGRRVNNLVQQRFGGDYQKAFNNYAQGGKEVSKAGVEKLLGDADVGNFATRGLYTKGVMDQFDTNRNNAISWSEFSGGMRAAGINVGGGK